MVNGSTCVLSGGGRRQTVRCSPSLLGEGGGSVWLLFLFCREEKTEIRFLKGRTSQIVSIGHKLILQNILQGDIEELKQNVLMDQIQLITPLRRPPT